MPRPNVTCRRPNPDQPVPSPGTVVETSDGHVLVYVGDRPGEVDIERLAARLRLARTVLLLGDMWEAARPAKHTLLARWVADARTAREAARPAAVPKPPASRCGHPRTDGKPCRQWAGAGTDTPGAGPCARHGGPTALKDAAARRLAEQAQTVGRLRAKARTAPLTPAEQLDGVMALRGLLVASQQRQRSP